jgi:hypothetical protein
MVLVWDLFMIHGNLDGTDSGPGGEERYPQANPRLIRDNGSRFISGDFHELMKLLEILRPGPPAKQRETGGVSSHFEKRRSAEERLF